MHRRGESCTNAARGRNRRHKKSDPKVAFLLLPGVQWALEANMAQRTGLEPATPGVTGRYSNRLNYRCA